MKKSTENVLKGIGVGLLGTAALGLALQKTALKTSASVNQKALLGVGLQAAIAGIGVQQGGERAGTFGRGLLWAGGTGLAAYAVSAAVNKAQGKPALAMFAGDTRGPMYSFGFGVEDPILYAASKL